MKKLLLLSIFLLFSTKGFSQLSTSIEAYTIRLGYMHNNHKNTAFLGAGMLYGDLFYTNVALYGGIHYFKYHGANRIVPEIGADFHLLLLASGVSVTPYSVQPKLGVTLLSVFEITAGYSIPFREEKLFDGFTLGITVQIPLKKKKK